MTTFHIASAKKSFASYFRLKDAARATLKLNPDRDSALYVDLANVGEAIERAFQTVPKVVVQGDFGTGKTHVLRVAEAYAHDHAESFRGVFLSLSGFESRTGFIEGVHRALIGQLLDVALSDVSAYDRMLGATETFEGFPEPVRQSLRELRASSTERVTAARAWLNASRTLTPSKALKAGYAALLDEVMKPADLAALYVAIARAWRAVTGQTLVLFLDEGESFTRVVHEDAQASIGAGLRVLLDSTNDALGIFIGLNTPRTRKGTHPMLRSDVRSRVGPPIVLQALQDTSLRERFVDGLWEKLAADPQTLPFNLDREAQRFVLNEIDSIRRRVLQDQAHTSPTQRDMLAVLDLIAQSAYAERAKLPLGEETLRRWVGIPRAALTG